jgi:hypothetical protein
MRQSNFHTKCQDPGLSASPTTAADGRFRGRRPPMPAMTLPTMSSKLLLGAGGEAAG